MEIVLGLLITKIFLMFSVFWIHCYFDRTRIVAGVTWYLHKLQVC